MVGFGYILCRSLGRFVGAYISSYFTSLSKTSRKNIGFGLVPQAGIAIDLATIAEQSVPGATRILTGVVLTGALAFEIGRPLLISSALKETGEATE